MPPRVGMPFCTAGRAPIAQPEGDDGGERTSLRPCSRLPGLRELIGLAPAAAPLPAARRIDTELARAPLETARPAPVAHAVQVVRQVEPDHDLLGPQLEDRSDPRHRLPPGNGHVLRIDVEHLQVER